MVTCPWCGTNYAAFQSNCSRCGGPMPAPRGTEAPAREDELTFPPPPPRPISDGYRWKLMGSDAWSIAAFIFALLGTIFTILGAVLTILIVTAFVGIPFLVIGLPFLGGGGYILYRRYQETMKAVNILRNGEACRGQVSGSHMNTSVTVNGRHPLTIEYSFQAQGEDHHNTLTTLNQQDMQYQAGKAVCVLYLPEDPQYSTLYPHP